MEVVKLDSSNSSSDSGGNGLASVSNKVWNGEYLGRLFLVVLIWYFKVPYEGRKGKKEGGRKGRRKERERRGEKGRKGWREREAQSLVS